MPTVVWLVLLSGGVITIASTYFFGMPRQFVQFVMTGMRGINPHLDFGLDHPFIGANRVTDAPLRQALEITNGMIPSLINSR